MQEKDPYAAIATPVDPYADLEEGDPTTPVPQAPPAGSAYHKPLPELPQDLTGVIANAPTFYRQTKEAAGKDLSTAWQGIKNAANSTLDTLKKDPSNIVPLWFGGLMGTLGASAKAVAAPVNAAVHGDVSDALSLAAGGNPDAAKQYRDQGNTGGEFWEMMGKPLAMLAAGKALGMVGGAIPEGADIARLRVVRGLMRDTGAQAGVDIGQAQLAQQALQDAARETYGTGLAGQSALGKSLPIKDRGILDILGGKPLTRSRVEAGNSELMRLSQRAVELAGTPADQINSLFGYMDGRQAAQSIKADLLRQADAAQKNGLTSYANALKQRASAMDGKNTLGDIYNVKKAANKLSGVVKNTQESIDLMDSWSALASAIRNEVYPLYERQVQSTMPGFSIAQAGQKEGAAMALRNGLEKRLATAQGMSDELNIPGRITQMAGHGAPEHRLGIAAGVRKAQEVGLLPTEQGQLNKAGRKAIGPLSPDTVPENLQVTRQPSFGPAPPQTTNLLPGATMKFQIPGNLPVMDTEGQIAHSAAKVDRHAFEQPAYTTSSAPNRTLFGDEGTMGADVNTAVPPQAQSDVARGAGVIETSDPQVAQSALDRMLLLQKQYIKNGATYQEQTQLGKAIKNLQNQLAAYKQGIGKARITHVPPMMSYSSRVTGKIPVKHSVRAAAPAAAADVEREMNDPTKWYNQR